MELTNLADALLLRYHEISEDRRIYRLFGYSGQLSSLRSECEANEKF